MQNHQKMRLPDFFWISCFVFAFPGKTVGFSWGTKALVFSAKVHEKTRWHQLVWTRCNMRVSTRLKNLSDPSTKGGGLRPPPFVEAAEGRLPLWMGLTGFFKRVETRMFQRVQTSWFQRAFHELSQKQQFMHELFS